MNKQDVQRAKKSILKCLTQDFKHGRKTNLAIFDEKEGYQCFNDTSLSMVMDKVVLGLYLALDEDEPKKCEDNDKVLEEQKS